MLGLEKLASLLKGIKPGGMNPESNGVMFPGGGTLPASGPMVRPPISTEAAAPDLDITPQSPIAPPTPAGFFNKGNPYANLKKEAATREMYPDADFSNRSYADPVQQAKFEKVYGDPMASGKTLHDIERPGFKGRMKQGGIAALHGLAQGGIGGALGGFLGGSLDPEGSQEAIFDVGEGAKMRQEQEYQQGQQTAQAKLAEIFARIKREQAQADAAGQHVVDGSVVGRGGNVIYQGKPKDTYHNLPANVPGYLKNGQYGENPGYQPAPQRPVSIGGIDHNWNPQSKKWEPALDAQGKPMKSTPVITAGIAQQGQDQRLDKSIQSRERIAGQSSKDRREIAVFNKGAKDAQSGGASEYQKWASLRKKALNEDGKLSQQEVDAAVMQMNEAAEKLRNNPNFKVGGEGGWSWVEQQKGGGTMGVGKRILLSKLKAAGQTREAAEAAGYTVVED